MRLCFSVERTFQQFHPNIHTAKYSRQTTLMTYRNVGCIAPVGNRRPPATKSCLCGVERNLSKAESSTYYGSIKAKLSNTALRIVYKRSERDYQARFGGFVFECVA